MTEKTVKPPFTPYHQQGGLQGGGVHINCPDILKRGWCFDANEMGDLVNVCRTVDAGNPLRCHCGKLAVSRDHLHPYHQDYTLCREHWDARKE